MSVVGQAHVSFVVGGHRVSADLLVSDAIEELILGIDWLTANDCVWDFGAGLVKWNGKEVKLQRQPNRYSIPRIHADRNLIIPSKHQRNVPGKTTRNPLRAPLSDWGFEPKKLRQEVLVARTLQDGDEAQATTHIPSGTDKPFSILRDRLTGRAKPAVAMEATTVSTVPGLAGHAATASSATIGETVTVPQPDVSTSLGTDRMTVSDRTTVSGATVGETVSGSETVFSAVTVTLLPEDPPESRPADVNEYADAMAERQRTAFEMVHAHTGRQVERMERQYNTRVNECQFDVGSFVYFFCPKVKVGRFRKWSRRYSGPVRVMKQINQTTYVLKRTPRSKEFVAHIDKLKPFYGTVPSVWEGVCNGLERSAHTNQPKPSSGNLGAQTVSTPKPVSEAVGQTVRPGEKTVSTARPDLYDVTVSDTQGQTVSRRNPVRKRLLPARLAE